MSTMRKVCQKRRLHQSLWLFGVIGLLGLTGCFGMIGNPPPEGLLGGPQAQPPSQRPPSRRTPADASPDQPPPPPDTGGADITPDTSVTPPPAPLCSVPSPAIQRITRDEYKYSILDVLGLDVDVNQLLPSDNVQDYGFAAAEGFSVKYAKSYMEAAEHIVSRLTPAQLAPLLPCQLEAGDEACAKTFFQRLGRRLFRRPVSAGEETRAMALFRSLQTSFGFAEALRVSLQFFLQSPHFLYRIERGKALPGAAASVLTGYEIATRLAAFLWQTTPDETLLQAAQDGKLESQAEIEGQARRMLSHVNARRTIHRFFEQWLDLEHLDSLVKDKATYPEFSTALALDMKTETMTFVDHVIWQQDASFKTLLTARYSFLNERLAKHYGIAGVLGQSFRRVDWSQAERIGVLTHGSLMTTHANIDQSSPIHRGVFVRKRLLCGEPKIPDGLDVSPPKVDPSLPTRKRFEEHRKNPECAGCHSLFDPIGFGFEFFDGIGRFRDTEGGAPVDARGDLVATDIDGSFNGPVELAHKLVNSKTAQQCFVKHWFRFAMGRRETANDACLIESVQEDFVKRGLDIKELLILLVTHPLYRYAQGEVSASIDKVGQSGAPLTAQEPATTTPALASARELRGCSMTETAPRSSGLWIVLSFFLALCPFLRRKKR